MCATGGVSLRAPDFLGADCEEVLTAPMRAARGSESVGDGVDDEVETGSECVAASVCVTDTEVGESAVRVLRAPSSESGASRDHSMRLAAVLLVMRRVCECAECIDGARVESALALERAHFCTELSRSCSV